MNWDILILFEDFKSVDTPQPMGGCMVWWVGWWLGGLMGWAMSNHKKLNKSRPNQDNSILFEDLWFAETPLPMDGWVNGWSLSHLPRHPHVVPVIPTLSLSSPHHPHHLNESRYFHSVWTFEICGDSPTHGWVYGVVGWVNKWGHVKSLKIE